LPFPDPLTPHMPLQSPLKLPAGHQHQRQDDERHTEHGWLPTTQQGHALWRVRESPTHSYRTHWYWGCMHTSWLWWSSWWGCISYTLFPGLHPACSQCNWTWGRPGNEATHTAILCPADKVEVSPDN